MIDQVADFYDGKSILILGVTGFLGKMLLEKMLYSCPRLNKVYVIIRSKKNKSAEDRLKSIIEQSLFSRLKNNNPQAIEKIIPIEGDIDRKNLGMNSYDENVLIHDVSVVFHLAANINFNVPLETLFKTNVEGTERVMNLCKRMKNIQKFIYVSTAYSNSDRSVIEENIYPAPITLEKMKKLLICGLEQEEVNKIISGKANIYAFTKCLAEEFINENHGHVPSIIIRPSIVTSSLSEPLPGWADKWSGVSGMIFGVGSGLISTVVTKGSNVLDIIPVDYVTNLTIVAAAKSIHSCKDVPVFNSATSETNPYTMKNIIQDLLNYFSVNKISDLDTGVTCTMSKSKANFISLYKRKLPFYVADLGLSLRGKKTKYMKMLDKPLLVSKLLIPFTSKSWVIQTQKTRALASELSDTDKVIFPFNPSDVMWADYMPVCCEGLKKYLLSKENNV